jgi:hypothetical protein
MGTLPQVRATDRSADSFFGNWASSAKVIGFTGGRIR